MKRKSKKRNLVAKSAPKSGAGAHVDKKGDHAPRNRQKKQWKKAVDDLLDLSE